MIIASLSMEVLEVNLIDPRHLLDNTCSLNFNELAAVSVTNACWSIIDMVIFLFVFLFSA
jgi:hypothetical protein